MGTRETLRELADISASQWGMVTSAQAAARGVTELDGSRLADAGDLERISQGVYKNAGAPAGTFVDVRAVERRGETRALLAGERLSDGNRGVVVSGQTAAWLHDIGDLRSNRTELTTPIRRQTQRADVHYRQRDLSVEDVTIRDGLPVTTPERTIADLVEDRTDLSIVANALRDASRKYELDLGQLEADLAPLAARNGHRKGDGAALARSAARRSRRMDREAHDRTLQSAAGVEAARSAMPPAAPSPSTSPCGWRARIRQEYFRRFLSRVFLRARRVQVLLKGGAGVLARVASGERTTDVDLYRANDTLDGALTELIRLASIDLGDQFRFLLALVRDRANRGTANATSAARESVRGLATVASHQRGPLQASIETYLGGAADHLGRGKARSHANGAATGLTR